jgi:hypothetical protein
MKHEKNHRTRNGTKERFTFYQSGSQMALMLL